MFDFTEARMRMVDSQVRTADVTDLALVAALRAVPRERFVPETLRPLAYADSDLQLKPASAGSPPRYLMETAPFARLVQAAELEPGEGVLDVGAATGYGAAILARLAARVVALESDAELAAVASANLAAAGAASATVAVGPLPAGWPAGAPYDVILIEGAVEEVPAALLAQLADGGRLLAVVGQGRAAPAMRYTRSGEEISGRPIFDADLRPLPGFRRPRGFVF
jgi:protein-L-isoaspartate(D-aspartate) O-methyltransferase